MVNYKRKEDGTPIHIDSGLENTEYPKIPGSLYFQRDYFYELAAEIIHYQWSPGYNRWGASVRFEGSTETFFTWPMTKDE